MTKMTRIDVHNKELNEYMRYVCVNARQLTTGTSVTMVKEIEHGVTIGGNPKPFGCDRPTECHFGRTTRRHEKQRTMLATVEITVCICDYIDGRPVGIR